MGLDLSKILTNYLKKEKIRVYIASCYTHGWMPTNVRRQIEAKHILMDYGFYPFPPLENHFAELFKHRPEEEWFDWDLSWLELCDILIRIHAFDENGVEIISPGSDVEMEFARQHGKPIYEFNNLKELEEWCKQYGKSKNIT